MARLLLFVTLLFAGCAGTPRPPSEKPASAPTVAPVTPEQHTPGQFLYQLAAGGHVSYLLGTMHLGFGFDEVLTPGARQAFAASPRVWMEADVTHADPTEFMQAAMLPPERSLHGLVGDEVWRAVVDKLGRDVPPAVLDRLEPWMPATLLGLLRVQDVLSEVKPGAEGRRMDLELMAAAQSAHKELHYLETVAEQLAVFESVPLDEQVRELAHTVSDSSRSQGRAMLDAFARGDEQALEVSLFDEAQIETTPGFYDALLYRRNDRWLTLLAGELSRGGAFIAVGAAHLYGERGLLAELRKRGFVVARVP